MLKDGKRLRSLRPGWQYRVITSLSPINEPFLSFNTDQKPRIKSPKSGNFENKNYIGRSPDPFSSRPNIKEEKAVWLRETSMRPHWIKWKEWQERRFKLEAPKWFQCHLRYLSTPKVTSYMYYYICMLSILFINSSIAY